jgi:phenylacetate-CoA ligase
MEGLGIDPATSSVNTLFIGGEPGVSIAATRQRLEHLWNARAVEFYGCTEASPHVGGFSCAYSTRQEPTFAHLLEDVQIWETVDAQTLAPAPTGQRGLTVCTSLNSESSPQLRFMVGDYTVLNREPCACGRSHVRAMGSFVGRADDVINVRGIKFFPSQVEEAIRAVPGTGDEFEIVLTTNAEGLNVMQVRLEHADHAASEALAQRIAEQIRSQCEVRASVEILPINTLQKTEFKAKRVKDQRK